MAFPHSFKLEGGLSRQYLLCRINDDEDVDGEDDIYIMVTCVSVTKIIFSVFFLRIFFRIFSDLENLSNKSNFFEISLKIIFLKNNNSI